MEVEPSQEVTGGLIGEDSFDIEKVEIIQERILEYLSKHGQTSQRELSLYVKQMGVLSTGHEYREEHIK